MRTAIGVLALMGLAFAPSVQAFPNPKQFVHTSDILHGGAIPDLGINIIPLFLDADGDPNDNTVDYPAITSLELEINGLSHTSPEDLLIYLIDPFGTFIDVMTNLGNGTSISGVDLIFNNDTGVGIPGTPITSGTYLPEGFFNGDDLGLARFVTPDVNDPSTWRSGGTDSWKLLIIDGSRFGTGSIDTYTLRGTYIPEPMTLSLLAIGAFVALGRKRW